MVSFVTPLCITAYIIRRTSDGARYLLIRRCSKDYLFGTWQMVTGRTNEGETAVAAALREIQEETGLIPSQFYTGDAVETFYLPHENRTIFVPVFVAFVEEMNVRLSPSEHDAYEWLPFEEARKRLVWAEQQRIIALIHERFVLKTPHELLRLTRTGVYGVAMENGKLLLVKQKKGPHRGKYDLPGGKIEAGETIEEALRREFLEEVGMTFETMRPIHNFTAATEGLHQEGLIYQVDGLSPIPNLPTELEYFWMQPNLPKTAISPFVAQMLKQDLKS